VSHSHEGDHSLDCARVSLIVEHPVPAFDRSYPVTQSLNSSKRRKYVRDFCCSHLVPRSRMGRALRIRGRWRKRAVDRSRIPESRRFPSASEQQRPSVGHGNDVSRSPRAKYSEFHGALGNLYIAFQITAEGCCPAFKRIWT